MLNNSTSSINNNNHNLEEIIITNDNDHNDHRRNEKKLQNQKIVETTATQNQLKTEIDVSSNITVSCSTSTKSMSYDNSNCIVNEQQINSNSATLIYDFCQLCNQYDQLKTDDNDKKICLCDLNSSNNYTNNNTLINFQISSKFPQNFFKNSMIFDSPGQIYNYINRCRRWIKVLDAEHHKHLKLCNQFSLTTYNILAQNLLLNHLYLYRDQDKSNLEWLERSNRLKKELLELNSDIFCLQEVHIENFNTSLLPLFKERGYQIISMQKTGQNHDGCSIIFKKNKFQLLDSLRLQMNRLNVSHVLDRDQIALVVKLRPTGNFKTDKNTNLIVANTHLIFNPRRGDIKLAQLRLLLAEIQKFAVRKNLTKSSPNHDDPFKMDYYPIILCGDFNSEPKSPLIEFIEKGEYNFRGLYTGDISGQKDGFEKGKIIQMNDILMNGIDMNTCYTDNKSNSTNNDTNTGDLIIRHVFKFKSVYPIEDQFNLKFISTSTHLDCGLVDHLFYSHNHKNLHLSAFKQLMNKQNLKKIGNIPNSILGSDHIALSAKFYLS